MADLYAAPAAIDFQQDLFYEPGARTENPDEDKLRGTIAFSGSFSFRCPLRPYFLMSFSVLALVLGPCGWAGSLCLTPLPHVFEIQMSSSSSCGGDFVSI